MNKENNNIKLSFSEIWDRINCETDIKNFSQLAQLIGITQQSVSSSKRKDRFPINWAYIVARKFDLLTEWILTGKGPKSLDDLRREAYHNSLAVEIDRWIDFMKERNMKEVTWFEVDFSKKYPEFKEWREKYNKDYT